MLEFRLPFWQVPMSHCSVCGQEYGLTHNCAGIAPLTTADETSMQLGYPIPWALMATDYPQTLAYTLASGPLALLGQAFL